MSKIYSEKESKWNKIYDNTWRVVRGAFAWIVFIYVIKLNIFLVLFILLLCGVIWKNGVITTIPNLPASTTPSQKVYFDKPIAHTPVEIKNGKIINQ